MFFAEDMMFKHKNMHAEGVLFSCHLIPMAVHVGTWVVILKLDINVEA